MCKMCDFTSVGPNISKTVPFVRVPATIPAQWSLSSRFTTHQAQQPEHPTHAHLISCRRLDAGVIL